MTEQRGRYQLLQNRVWSEWSEMMCMDTEEYESYDFEWDTNPLRKHADILLINTVPNMMSGNKTFKLMKSGFYRTIISKMELSSECMNAVALEFTLRDLGSKGVRYLLIGFVESEAVRHVRLDQNIGQSDRAKECALLINSNGFYEYTQGQAITFFEEWRGRDCRNGDRISMVFDFVNFRCTVSYNEQTVGILSTRLPNRMHIVASPHTPALILDTTKCEFFTDV